MVCVVNLSLISMIFAIVLNANSAEAVVLTAYEAHFLKDVSRAQLNSALKLLCSAEQRKSLLGKEKKHINDTTCHPVDC